MFLHLTLLLFHLANALVLDGSGYTTSSPSQNNTAQNNTADMRYVACVLMCKIKHPKTISNDTHYDSSSS
jgi:hypothetical protein